MSGRWFRLYEDVLNDPKLQKLPAETFRGLINIWCIASANNGRLPPMGNLGFLLRMSDADACQLIVDLDKAGLLDTHEDYTCPHNWDGRQFKSDHVSERVKRHRERRRGVAGDDGRNDDETLHETPLDTDTEQKQSRAETERESNARAHTIPSDWKPKDAGTDPAEVRRFVTYYAARGTAMANWDAAWEAWGSRVPDFGKAKTPPPAEGPIVGMTWVGEDDARWGSVAARHVAERGKALVPATSMHASGFGAFVPADWLEKAAA